MTPDDEAQQFLSSRAATYKRVFNKDSVDVQALLADLAKFCRAHESTAHVNPAVSAHLDGRREVWLRIQSHLQLTDEELWRVYAGRPQTKGEKNE